MTGTPNLRPREAATIDPVGVLDPTAVQTIPPRRLQQPQELLIA